MEEGDCLANIMYYAWTRHGIKPSKIYSMPKEELSIIRAFYVIETESKKGGGR